VKSGVVLGCLTLEPSGQFCQICRLELGRFLSFPMIAFVNLFKHIILWLSSDAV